MSRKNLLLAAAALAAVGLAATGARADAFQNGSFELGTFTDNQGGGQNTDRLFNGSTVMTGWTVVSGPADVSWGISPDVFNINASAGTHYIDLTGYCDSGCGGFYGGVSQTFDTVAGATYSVSFDLGNDGQYDSNGSGLLVSAGNQSNLSFSQAFTALNANGETSVWQTETFSFVAQGTSSTLAFAGNKGDAFIGLDNVAVSCDGDCVGTTAGGVPEPASWALMMLGFGGMGAVLRSRRRGAFAAA
jgi:hypothetical protein